MTLDIPNYRIVEKLGVGAQTRIFRARCMRTGKDYAIKTTKVQRPEDMATVDMMRAEYAIGSTLNHAS
jgi:serine/threonine protein kinase